MPKGSLATQDNIASSVLLIRGHRVMPDTELAALYGVEVKALIQAIKRNKDRFPDDFMFQLTWEEIRNLGLNNSSLKSTSNSTRS